MKIGIENFRTFKDYTEFEIRPITILIGPNNSGKSSFTKFLLLLKNGWEKLDFLSKNDSNLESYEKSLNWNSSSKEITVKFDITNNLLFNNEQVSVTYDENGKIHHFSLFNGIIESQRRTIFNAYSTEIEGPIYEKEEIDENSITLRIDIQKFLNFIKSQTEQFILIFPTKFYFLKQNKHNEYKQESIYVNLLNEQEIIETINAIKNSPLVSQALEYQYPILLLALLYQKLKNTKENHILYDIYVDNENLTENYQNTIAKIQNKMFNESNFIRINSKFWNLPNILLKGLCEINNLIKISIEDHIKAEYLEFISTQKFPQIVISENNLGKMLFSNKFNISGDQVDVSNFEKLDFSNMFMSNIFDSLQQLSNVTYIPANRGSQQRVHEKDSYSFKLTSQFNLHNQDSNSAKKIEKYKSYLKEVSNALNLDGEIDVKFFEGSVSAIYLNNQNLADYGFGYSQIIPILIELFNASYNHSKFLIIEEPEANLHPALQSQLANVFVITNKFFPKINLIIETHSEYIIRKLQYLVAAKEVSSEQCIIHYFNADKNVSLEEPKVKPIEINEDGNLTDNFGPGFYDEATRLQFELMKIRQEQKN